MNQWPPFFGGKRAYSTARETAKAAKPHLNPFSSTSDKVTARAKPPEYLQASFLKREHQQKTINKKQTPKFFFSSKNQTYHLRRVNALTVPMDPWGPWLPTSSVWTPLGFPQSSTVASLACSSCRGRGPLPCLSMINLVTFTLRMLYRELHSMINNKDSVNKFLCVLSFCRVCPYFRFCLYILPIIWRDYLALFKKKKRKKKSFLTKKRKKRKWG